MSTPTGPGWWVRCAAIGCALGALNSLVNVFGARYGGYPLRPDGVPALQLVGALLGTQWAWALLAFWIGWFARRWRSAVGGALLALWVATPTYYLSDWLGGRTDDFAHGFLAVWMILAIPAALAFGSAGHLGRRPDPWSLLPLLAAPAVVALDRRGGGTLDIQPWPTILQNLIAALLLILVLGLWFTRDRRRPDSDAGRDD
ncbi:DUF6518 family protein [Enemella evansiae]|uniref:DUF6518 family protein n=1 Tax=Enemella evansiae TaxID=2016499 RepID=UPI000B96ED12|nr:DUF6518 family protein [Enemella evansiae]OYO05269.1 hypothetical protein CGZ97_00525 [Enemella evansiae]